MTEQARVTGIVATHNRPLLLRRAVRSMIDQSDVRLSELVVVFDQSEIDRELVNEFDFPIRLVANHNSPGLAGARNTGIQTADTEWIAFCDDDDEWMSHKLSTQLAHANDDTHFVVGGIEIRYGDRTRVRTPGRAEIRFEHLIEDRIMAAHPSTYLVRRAAIALFGEVDETLPGGYAEDYDWLLRASRLRPITVADQPVSIVHWHPGTFFGSRYEMIYAALEDLLEKTPEFTNSKIGLARILGQQAFAKAALGEARPARKLAWKTLKLDPTQLRSYLALAVSAGLISSERLQVMANRTGRGI